MYLKMRAEEPDGISVVPTVEAVPTAVVVTMVVPVPRVSDMRVGPGDTEELREEELAMS